MSTREEAHRAEQSRREAVNQLHRDQQRSQGRRHRVVVTAWVVGLLVIAGIIAGMMLTSRPESSAAARPAPEFTLTSTSGDRVDLAELRGHNVLLYFSEGAGCQSCLVQMAAIEKRTADLKELNLTVLPIVMNTREQIVADMTANGVRTPFLLDDGTVSSAYGTLGRGMHPGLPGHSFVLIDANGVQRWHGDYPSMWLAPDDLFSQVRSHLAR